MNQKHNLSLDNLVYALALGDLAKGAELFLSSGTWSKLFSLHKPQDRQIIAQYVSSPLVPVVFLDAKATQKELLHFGIDVPRPVCLKTLHMLSSRQVLPDMPVQNHKQAQMLVQKILMQLGSEITRIERQSLQKIARLESLLTRPFASMEFHGLPIDREQWQGLINQAKSEEASAKNAKLISTYGDNFLAHIRIDTGRLHPSFVSLGSSTGRSSCHSPNIQNLPSSQDFHACIKAPPGRSLVSADYSACELRILASFADEPVFIDAFEQNIDIHAQVASQIFKVPVSKEENAHLRQRAKAINFGLMYGMGANALANNLQIEVHEAQELLGLYFRQFPKIKSYLDEAVKTAKENGFVQSAWGRKLVFKDHFGADSTEDVSRLARNMPIQGTAADMIKLAMISTHELLKRDFTDAFMVNMIHDEIVVECASYDAATIAQMLKAQMEIAQKTMLPNLKPGADVTIGPCWL